MSSEVTRKGKSNLTRISIISCLILLTSSPLTGHAGEGSVLLFPQLDVGSRSGTGVGANNFKSEEAGLGLDVFGTYHFDRITFLGEYYVNKDEQELERLQIGWETPQGTLWLGRYHIPYGYWNAQYHHGMFMQTTVTRPDIVRFEGIMPMHVGGLLFEDIRPFSNPGTGFSVAVGTGPSIDDEIKEWTPERPRALAKGLSTAVKIFHEPVAFDQTVYGVFAGFNDIDSEIAGVEGVKQTVYGAYANWQGPSHRVLSEFYWVTNKIDQVLRTERDSFLNAYIQLEKPFNRGWTVFGRVETTKGKGGDAYLALFPQFVDERRLVGLRFDANDHAAVKLEWSDNNSALGDYHQFVLQWSLVF